MVTELVKSENSYQAAFRTVRELSPTVAWLELVRSSAMDRFEQLGFPSGNGRRVEIHESRVAGEGKFCAGDQRR